MASIDRVDAGWRARFRTPDGKSRSRTFRRKLDAEAFLAEIGHARNTGAFIDPEQGRLTLAAWHQRWWASTVDLRPSTRVRVEGIIRLHVLPRFGGWRLVDITHQEVQDWVAALSASGQAPASVQKTHQQLSKMLAAAVKDRRLATNPAAGVDLPRIEQEEMRFLDPDEVATLAESIDARYRPLVLVGAYSGLRIGEMAGLRRSRVDLHRGRVDVVEALVEVNGRHHFGPAKTRQGRRTVPLPRSVLTELERHVAGLGPDGLVFTAPEGGPLRRSLFHRRFWAPATEAAGVAPLRIHDLRHTAVAFWIAAGASPKEIARRAGHASVVTVLDRYGHLLPGDEDRVTEALDVMAQMAAARPLASITELS